jgi:GTP pyrophosphokinase
MKTELQAPTGALAPAAPIVALTDVATGAADAEHSALLRARAFAEPLISSETLDTGENTLVHADAVAAILKGIGGSEAMQAATYLVYACRHLTKPLEVISKAFGVHYAELALETTKLVNVQQQVRAARRGDGPPRASLAPSEGRALRQASERGGHLPKAQLDHDPKAQLETVRKMLLAFSRDLRVVMLRLASRLQTLRYCALTRQTASAALAHESLHVFAPLANRLGIWQIKWEMEDLAFRFLEPDTYKKIAQLLDEKRVEREASARRSSRGRRRALSPPRLLPGCAVRRE